MYVYAMYIAKEHEVPSVFTYELVDTYIHRLVIQVYRVPHEQKYGQDFVKIKHDLKNLNLLRQHDVNLIFFIQISKRF